MTLLRLIFLAGIIHFGYALAFPDWSGHGSYHMTTASVIVAGALLIWLLIEVLVIGSELFHFVLEIVFLAAVFVYLGRTLPQASGRSPWQQWAAGYRPAASDLRRGFDHFMSGVTRKL